MRPVAVVGEIGENSVFAIGEDRVMSIDVRIESEDGDIEAELFDPGHLTARLADSYPGSDSICLRFIDPYGDTTFNQVQLPVLIVEIESALESATDSDVKAHGQAMLELARQANSHVHTYLKFYGD